MDKSFFQPVSTNINFPEMEQRLLDTWYKEGIVEKYLHRNDTSNKYFSFLDGPITANNPMGVHHAWGRTYKDLWQRFYNLRGYTQRFQNGFDCQGLWVEVEVEKELGIKNKKDIENLVPGDRKASIAKFVELCRARVLKYSAIQTEQSKRLGYIVDWDHSYFTMSDENNYMIWHFLKTCFEKGWIYKGTDSVPWCPRCETAISQHEMLTEDYKEVTHESVIMELPMDGKDREFLLVWTTTPWTIPANIAVAVDSKADYALVRGGFDPKDKFWVAVKLIDAVFKGKHGAIVKTVKGKELAGLHYKSVFDGFEAVEKARYENPDKFHIVIETDPLIMPISMEEGTGLVHTAVSAGTEDFNLGKKLELPMIPVIGDNADYVSGFREFSGKNAKKNPRLILDYMEKREKEEGCWVFTIFPYTHRYPACWRCKTELVWKVEKEWYIAMDKKEICKSANKKTLRQQMVDTAMQIIWKPEFGLERELDWLNNMHDWLISKKNRYWGLALPIWECRKCGWFTVVGSREELRNEVKAGWEQFEGKSPHKPYIDDVKIICGKCKEATSRINDVGNVWLDAGIVGFSTLIDPQTNTLSYTTDKRYWRQWYPADFITESFPGQFKNWFYSMIAMSTVLEKQTCFKTVLGYGSMLGEDGRPMHKSSGNMIDFGEGAEKIGADVMRWMFAKHNPRENLLFGYRAADEARRKFHLLVWNIYKFFITYARTDAWHPKTQNSGFETHSENILDQWILIKLDELIYQVTKSLEMYDAMTAAIAIEAFVTDLSQWYVRRSRDRVGPIAQDISDKKNCYATLYTVLVTLCKILAPFTPYLADELYRTLTREESVHLANWPECSDFRKHIDSTITEKMHHIRGICELGHAFRKAHAIKVRQPLSSCSIGDAKWNIEGQFLQLVKDELNVKNLHIRVGKKELHVILDTTISPELLQEGRARELVRQIQLLRKDKGCTIDERIAVSIPDEYKNFPKSFIEYIQRETLSDSIVWADKLDVLMQSR